MNADDDIKALEAFAKLPDDLHALLVAAMGRPVVFVLVTSDGTVTHCCSNVVLPVGRALLVEAVRKCDAQLDGDDEP